MPTRQSLKTASLSIESSTRTFTIHKALFLSKSNAIFSAVEYRFQEKEDSMYIFKETTEGIVTRFIEWVGRYTEETILIQFTMPA